MKYLKLSRKQPIQVYGHDFQPNVIIAFEDSEVQAGLPLQIMLDNRIIKEVTVEEYNAQNGG